MVLGEMELLVTLCVPALSQTPIISKNILTRRLRHVMCALKFFEVRASKIYNSLKFDQFRNFY